MPSHYFIFDTSALVFRYISPSNNDGSFIKQQVDSLFLAKAKDRKAIIFQLPNLCMAECSKVFAWACFEQDMYGVRKKEAVQAYGDLRDALLKDVTHDRIINSYEFDSDHVVDIEEIFMHDYFDLPKPNPSKKGKRLSSHDALIISIARAIAIEHAGGLQNSTLITAEDRMASMCHKFPDSYPRVVNVRRDSIQPELARLGF